MFLFDELWHTSTRQKHHCFWNAIGLLTSFIVVSQVIVKDVLVVLLAGLHRLQDGGEAPVQGREVGFGQERGNSRQRVLGKGLSHDVTQAEVGRGQEVQPEEGGVTDPARVIVKENEAPRVALLYFPLSLFITRMWSTMRDDSIRNERNFVLPTTLR